MKTLQTIGSTLLCSLMLVGCGAGEVTSGEGTSSDTAALSKSPGSSCTAVDYETIASISASYTKLVAEETTLSTELLTLTSAISSGEGASVIDADLEALDATAMQLETGSASAVTALEALVPKASSVITAQADAEKAFGDTNSLSVAVVTLVDAAIDQNPSSLKSFLPELQSLVATTKTISSEYAKVLSDISSSPCLEKQ